jgi:hypothetical protein
VFRTVHGKENGKGTGRKDPVTRCQRVLDNKKGENAPFWGKVYTSLLKRLYRKKPEKYGSSPRPVWARAICYIVSKKKGISREAGPVGHFDTLCSVVVQGPKSRLINYVPFFFCNTVTNSKTVDISTV